MRSHLAALSSVLIAIQPAASSYIPESPNSVEPTQAAVNSNHLLGVSPRITDSPIPDPGGLFGRANAYDRGPDTCAFYSDGYPLRCYASTATCGYGSKFAACCEQGTTCSSMFTGCYGFSDALQGSCSEEKLATETQMACCFDRSAPNCVLHTLLLSSTSIGVWGCATSITGETVYTTNPFLKTDKESPSATNTRKPTTSTSASTSESTSASRTAGAAAGSTGSADGDSNEKKSNTGAIVGGVVGGVGAIAILGAGIFFFLRSRKKNAAEGSPGAAAAAQPMLQQGPPGQGAQYGYYPQGGSPVYDPNMAYQQNQGSPQPYPPQSQSPYDPHQSGHSWGQPSPGLSTSPAPLGSTAPGSLGPASPGPTSSSPGPAGAHSGQAVELSQNNAVGTAENRAELG